MADPLQPESFRSPTSEAGVANRTGIVMPPDDVPDAGSSMDEMFLKEMGREPSRDDNTPDRDRKVDADAPNSEIASEIPDENPLEVDEVDDLTPAVTKEVVATEPRKAAEEGDDILAELFKSGSETPPAKKDPPAPKADDVDPYENIKLRSDASEKTKTTVEKLKRLAKEREQTAKDETAVARKEADHLKIKLDEVSKKTVAPEVEAELKQLREFRATYAAEQDPEFQQKFSSRLDVNNATIFEALKKNGLRDALIEQVKKLPYDEQVEQISRWADKLPARDKMLVNGRIADNENVDMDRKAALAEVKANAVKLNAERADAPKRTKEQFVAEAISTLKPLLPQLPFLTQQDIPDGASPKERADLEAHNKEAGESQSMLLGFLSNDSSRMRSILALTGVLAPRYQRQLKEATTRVETLEQELADIRKAGKFSRTARAQGASDGGPKMDIFNTNAESAMDAEWEKMQNR